MPPETPGMPPRSQLVTEIMAAMGIARRPVPRLNDAGHRAPVGTAVVSLRLPGVVAQSVRAADS